MTVRALICEDEPLMAERLRRMLAQAWPDLEIARLAQSGDEALEFLSHASVDVLFLDIRMPGCSGLEVAALAPPGAQIVFTTAYDEHAIAAFETGAVDYLLKPIEADRLARTIDRVRARLAAPPAQAMADLERVLATLGAARTTAAPHLTWLRCSLGSTIRLFKVADVMYFEADTKYTRVVTAAAEGLVRLTMRELLGQLDPVVFWQVHRGSIVNVEWIDRVVREGPERLSIRLKGRDGKPVVSRAYAHRFRRD